MRASVFLTGGDGRDWALDDDLRMTRQTVEDVVTLTNLKACDVVHTMGWDGLARIPEALLSGERIISHVPGEPFRYLHIPRYSRAARKIGRWIAQSTQAQHQLRSSGIESTLIPYTVAPELVAAALAYGPHFPELRYRRATGFVGVGADGVEVRLGGDAEAVGRQLTLLAAIEPELASVGSAVAFVDLRFERPFYRLRGVRLRRE